MTIKDHSGLISLGASPTPENNIVIKTPDSPDGKLEIYRGVPGSLGAKLFEVDEAGANFANLFGVNQTKQNVSSLRSPGVTYTNNTGALIEVTVAITLTALGTANAFADIVVGTGLPPLRIGRRSDYQQQELVTFTVLPGDTYSITLTGAVIAYWYEIRSI